MSLWVQKYGGTSVGSVDRIHQVAKRIAESRASGRSLVVVVSAMDQTTDELLRLAHEVSPQPSHRELDMLLTAGERISMSLLSMALADCQIPAVSLTGSQSGIITSDHHSRAKIDRILGSRVREGLEEGKVVIVAGFQGVNSHKDVTTLGRGGSDTTAVALAACLDAEACEIFTDVDGVYSADPRYVEGAQVFETLSYDLMVELASSGAGVLHSRSVELAKKWNVPLIVRNSLNHRPGTKVGQEMTKESQSLEGPQVQAVAVAEDQVHLSILLGRPSTIHSLLERTSAAGLVLQLPSIQGDRVSLFVERDCVETWQTLLNDLAQDEFIQSYQLDADLVPLSLLGVGLTRDSTILQNLFETLAQAEIFVTIGAATSQGLTVGVKRSRGRDAVGLLHRKFIEGNL